MKPLFIVVVLAALLTTFTMCNSVTVSDVTVIPLTKKFGEITANPAPKYNPVVHLNDKDGFFCTGFVIDANYIATAGHCLHDNNSLITEDINIISDTGEDTGVVAQAAGFATRSDFGLVTGDFSNFKYFAAEFQNFGFNEKDYYTCGFPYGVKRMVCTPFNPVQTSYFSIFGRGFIIPGFSGGAVVRASDGVVVGINSAAREGGIIVYPLQGFLGIFGIE